MGLQGDVECVMSTVQLEAGKDFLSVPVGAEPAEVDTAVHGSHLTV